MNDNRNTTDGKSFFSLSSDNNKVSFNIPSPEEWDVIPDIDLYIDQVIAYMKRQHPGLSLRENLTSSMVNNYAKQGLVPRAKGKKYNREHIAALTAVCLLKQVLPVSDVGNVMDNLLHDSDYEKFYTDYLSCFREEADKVSDVVEESAASCRTAGSDEEIYKAVLRMSVKSYMYKFAAEALLDALPSDSDEKSRKEK